MRKAPVSARSRDLLTSFLSCPDCQCAVDDTLHCTACRRSFEPDADGIIDALPHDMTCGVECSAGIRATIEELPREDQAAEIVRFEQSFHDQQASYYDDVHTN